MLASPARCGQMLALITTRQAKSTHPHAGQAGVVTRKKVGASPRISRPRDLPERAVTNAELTTRFAALGNPTVVDKLAASTGVTRRFYVPDDWVTSGLALPAAKEALKRGGRKPENADLIIVLFFRECLQKDFSLRGSR